jgi:hypothetical protein
MIKRTISSRRPKRVYEALQGTCLTAPRGWNVPGINLFQGGQRNSRKSSMKSNQNGQRPQTNAMQRAFTSLEASYSCWRKRVDMILTQKIIS